MPTSVHDTGAPPSKSSAGEVSDGAPLVVRAKTTLATGVTTWRNPINGFTIIDLEYVADPRKRDPQWEAAARAGTPSAEWNREYGSTWIVYEGKPVYGDYDEKAHLLTGNIVTTQRARLISGWDGGPTDVNLAWALALVSPSSLTPTFIDEYWVDDGDVEDFIQVVASKLQLEWAKLGGFRVHVADQATFTKSQIAMKSMADIMRQHGMPPIPGEISFAKRRSTVQTLLKLRDGFKVHERCELIREAISGGYVYPKMQAGVGGRYKETPLKNKFSHIMNAVEYVCSRLWASTQQVPFEGRRLPVGAGQII